MASGNSCTLPGDLLVFTKVRNQAGLNELIEKPSLGHLQIGVATSSLLVSPDLESVLNELGAASGGKLHSNYVMEADGRTEPIDLGLLYHLLHSHRVEDASLFILIPVRAGHGGDIIHPNIAIPLQCLQGSLGKLWVRLFRERSGVTVCVPEDLLQPETQQAADEVGHFARDIKIAEDPGVLYVEIEIFWAFEADAHIVRQTLAQKILNHRIEGGHAAAPTLDLVMLQRSVDRPNIAKFRSKHQADWACNSHQPSKNSLMVYIT